MILLHGFPQFWWAWRHQLPALAAAGYRAVAMDLRGYGASDKPPRGYDTLTLAAGRRGCGPGARRAPGRRRRARLGRLGGLVDAGDRTPGDPGSGRAVDGAPAADAAGVRPRRSTADPRAPAGLPGAGRPGTLAGAPGRGRAAAARPGQGLVFPDEATARQYQRAMQVPFVAHTSMEYYRWAVRSLWRRDGRRFAGTVREPVDVPVLQMHGACDPWVTPRDGRRLRAAGCADGCATSWSPALGTSCRRRPRSGSPPPCSTGWRSLPG